jgi:LCP family protein required for cell wall assembly
VNPLLRSFRAFTGRFVIALCIASAVMAAAVVSVNKAIDAKLQKATRVQVDVAPEPPGGANYLLIGVDNPGAVETQDDINAFGPRTGESLTDTIMVVHVEPQAGRTIILSFPRDLLVKIPGYGSNKINAAYNDAPDGGPNKVIDTLKTNFGISINHYVELNFTSFREIVNAMGGISINFEYPMRDKQLTFEVLTPGCVQLSGDEALSFTRMRYREIKDGSHNNAWWQPEIDASTPDVARIQRQQFFIQLLMSAAVDKSLHDPLAANRIADRVVEKLTLDQSFSKDNLFQLINAFRGVDPNDPNTLERQTFPFFKKAGDVSYLYPEFSLVGTQGPNSQAAKDLIARINDFSQDQAPPPTVAPADVVLEVRNGSGRNGLAESALAELTRLGFKGKSAFNDPRGLVAQTEIRYRPGAIAKARLLLPYVSPPAALQEDTNLRSVDVALVLGTDSPRILTPTSATTVAPAPAPSNRPGAATPTTAAPVPTTAAPPSPADTAGGLLGIRAC